MNQTKKHSKKILLICIPVILAVALIAGLVWSYSQTHVGGKDISDASVYETRYCKLYYPAAWADQVQVQVVEDIASFAMVTERGDVCPLFDVLFQQEKGIYLGDLNMGKETKVPVSLFFYDLGENSGLSAEEIPLYYSMQEDVNYLIERLSLLEPEADEAQMDAEETGDQEISQLPDIVIETAYGKLYYPGNDNAQLRTEELGNIIAFYASVADLPEQRLFDLCFDAAEGDALGYVERNGEKCYIDIFFYDIQEDPSWSQEQLEALWSVQEGVNYLLEKLEMVYFSASQEPGTEPAVGEEQMTIQTPYANLSYPAKWDAYLQTTVEEEEVYTVSFCANIPGKETVALFDICFGNGGDIYVGTLDTEDGQSVPVTVNMSDFVLDDSWTMEEQNAVYEMAEGLNEILEQLPLTEE